MVKMEGWRAGAFVVMRWIPRGPNFAKIHARGARGLQRIAPRDLIPPPGAQTFAEQSGKVYRGAGRVEGRVGSLGRGRAARDAVDGLAREGRQVAEPGRRAGPLGPQRGHVAATAGLSQQPGKRARRAAKANVGPNLGGSRASRAVPNLLGPVCGQKRRKNRGRGPKTGAAQHRRGLFPARAGRGGRRFGKNTVIRRRKKLHKPRTVITDPGAGAGSRPRTRYISRPFSGRFSLSDKSYFSPE